MLGDLAHNILEYRLAAAAFSDWTDGSEASWRPFGRRELIEARAWQRAQFHPRLGLLVSDLERLRALLLTPEQERLLRLEAGAEATVDALAALPERLPELLESAQRVAPAGRLGRAIAEPVADALGAAVQLRRQSIVDALFPIIMPAIRRAIAEYLRVLSSDINRLLESSFTPRGIGWRIESWRSGVPYAQIAIKRSLRYRVDHLLLIQSESGLVLDRESAADLPTLDADAIAGMLTAIGDFVRDSVSSQGNETLSSATVGEHLLWVIEGPSAKLAAFIQGIPPQSLKTDLQERLESLHARFGDALGQAPETLTGLPEIRDALVPDDLRSSQSPPPESSAKSPMRTLWWILSILGLILLVWLIADWRWQSRIKAASDALEVWPGFVLTDTRHRLWRDIEFRGLLDPIAASPENEISARYFPHHEVRFSTRGYLSSDADIVLQRLRQSASIPDTVSLTLSGQTLVLDGLAPLGLSSRLLPSTMMPWGVQNFDTQSLQWDLLASLKEGPGVPDPVQVEQQADGWIVSGQADSSWARSLSQYLDANPVFGNVDHSALVVTGAVTLQSINDALRALPFEFQAQTTPAANAKARLSAILQRIEQGQALASAAGQKLIIEVLGLNDAPGTVTVNSDLRRSRAMNLIQSLQSAGVSAGQLQLREASDDQLATIQIRAALAQLRLE